MQPTRRFWDALAIGAVLAVAALVFDRPVLLVGSAGVAAWLLAAQLTFVYELRRLDEQLHVEQVPDRTVALVEDEMAVTLAVDAPATSLDGSVVARPAPGLFSSGSTTAALGGTTVFSISTPVAGTHRLREPSVSVHDPTGLYAERFRAGEAVEVTVEQREPRRVHVGEQGSSLPMAFGAHTSKSTGAGITPAELREYVGGESVRRIDWKATARHPQTYVREFESESEVRTVFVIDHRGSLAVGPAGETAFDYLRAAALGYLTAAQSVRDPVGCYAVGDDGTTRLATPTNTKRGYDRIRRQLRALTPGTTRTRPRLSQPIRLRTPTLDTETTFGRTVRPYIEARRSIRAAGDPLEAAVRTATIRQRDAVQIVVFTDDTNRSAVKSAVTRASQGEHSAIAFIAPNVLFEPGSLSDLERAYDRYLSFERFRRDLSNIRTVRAFEVAPRDRLDAVLERGRVASL